jgi:peptidoglycan/xylan/chitin deacetylase (PgdA/CDA1 family)
MLRFLVERGFEIGNHTHDHVPLNTKDATGVQQALVLGRRLIKDAVPDAEVATLALPLGAMPDDPALALRGSWGGESYRHEGVFLVGAEPAPSPFAKEWNPSGVPRVRTGPWVGGEPDYSAGFWLDWLKRNAERRYISDGDPRTIAFPRSLRSRLRPRFEARARPY